MSSRRAPYDGRTHRAGFTLVETMVAMTILVVGAFGLFTLLITAVQMDMESSHNSTARALVQHQMEYVRALPWSSVTALYNSESVDGQGHKQGLTAPLANSVPSNGFTFAMISQLPNCQAKVLIGDSVDGTHASYRPVTVSVVWTEPGRGVVTIGADTIVTSDGLNTL